MTLDSMTFYKREAHAVGSHTGWHEGFPYRILEWRGVNRLMTIVERWDYVGNGIYARTLRRTWNSDMCCAVYNCH